MVDFMNILNVFYTLFIMSLASVVTFLKKRATVCVGLILSLLLGMLYHLSQ